MTLERIRRPLPARLLNLGDWVLQATGIRRDRLDPEAIKQDAAAAVGLDDFGSADFEEGLALICRSAETEGRIDAVGRMVLRAFFRRILGNRLLLVDHRKNGPELPALSQPPLIVLGLPRTGTTFLHRLLAQDPGVYGPPTWQVWRPLPRLTGPDRRREVAARALRNMHRLSPTLDARHHVAVDEPEECYHLLDPSFRAAGLGMICPVYAYFDWVKEQDPGPAYGMYHEFLRVIQQTAPGKRLALKTPLHTPYMEAIGKEMPGTLFVQTHRDVTEATGSLASLIYSMFSVTSPDPDTGEIGELALELMRWMARSCMEQRERCELAVVDVQYTDLVADPVKTVGRIYERHGLEWTPEVEAAVREGAARRPQHKQGRHRYELSDFGLAAKQVKFELAEYARAFLPQGGPG